MTTTTTATTTTVKEVPVEEEEKNEIIDRINPEDLGVNEINPNDLEVLQVGEEKESTPLINDDLVKVAEKLVTDEKAKKEIDNIGRMINKGRVVHVKSSLKVYKVKSKSTGKTTYISKITLTFTAEKDMKNVEIVEVIPKSVASDVSEIIFNGEVPEILQSDPVVKWSFDSVKSGETKDLSYTIKKKLDEIPSVTLAAAGVPKETGGWSWKKVIGTFILIVSIILLIYVEKDNIFGKKHFHF